jgi:hypothetical protein
MRYHPAARVAGAPPPGNIDQSSQLPANAAPMEPDSPNGGRPGNAGPPLGRHGDGRTHEPTQSKAAGRSLAIQHRGRARMLDRKPRGPPTIPTCLDAAFALPRLSGLAYFR